MIFDMKNPKVKSARDEAYRIFPDDAEPADYHPAGKIVVDRGNLRYAFLAGWMHANGQSTQGSKE